MIVGIDPGLKGGVCFYYANDNVKFMPMPTISVDGKNKVDAVSLYSALIGIPELRMVIVEKVGAMPGQGVTSMFSFGQSVGAIDTVVKLIMEHSAGVELYATVPPQIWKKYGGLLKTKKDEVLNRLGANIMFELNKIKIKENRIACAEAFYMCKYMEWKYSAPINK